MRAGTSRFFNVSLKAMTQTQEIIPEANSDSSTVFCCCRFVCLFVCLFWYWDWNSGPTPWATPRCDGFFRDGGVSQTICPGRLRTTLLLISASWVARITCMSHQRLAHCAKLVKHFPPQQAMMPNVNLFWIPLMPCFKNPSSDNYIVLSLAPYLFQKPNCLLQYILWNRDTCPQLHTQVPR
jgi:hypothetical protein